MSPPQQNTPSGQLTAEQLEFARNCQQHNIASYNDVVAAYQSNDTTKLDQWRQSLSTHMPSGSSVQRQKDTGQT